MTSNDTETKLAKIKILTSVTVVIPTYKEVENIPLIVKRIESVRNEHEIDLNLVFADDDSNDGSQDIVESMALDWVHIIVRKEDPGLSQSVIDGFSSSSSTILVCMDCDLSHPPEVIPAMILALQSGQELVIGSRYVSGGSTDDDWGLYRWLNSRAATLLASPLTRAKDPMSGFFAFRRDAFTKAKDRLNPIGYKICLEIIVKCGFNNIGEVPIQFADRVLGESKLNLSEQLKFIQHLRRLYIYKFGTAMDMAQFLVVGASGVVVNLAVLTLLSLAGFQDWVALLGGVSVSLVSNFLLNRRFTFSYARHKNLIGQFGGFLATSLLAMVINFNVANYINNNFLANVKFGLQFSAMIGVGAGMVFNFIGNRYLVFKKKFVNKKK